MHLCAMMSGVVMMSRVAYCFGGRGMGIAQYVLETCLQPLQSCLNDMESLSRFFNNSETPKFTMSKLKNYFQSEKKDL